MLFKSTVISLFYCKRGKVQPNRVSAHHFFTANIGIRNRSELAQERVQMQTSVMIIIYLRFIK
jgi:hypothetical protein